MNHLDDQTIRALIDQELRAAEREAALTHLEVCLDCSQRYTQIESRALQIEFQMNVSSTRDETAGLSTDVAYRRIANQINEEQKGQSKAWNLMNSKQLRPLVAGITALVLIVAFLAIPSVRAAAVDFLGLFRVQQIAVVEINPQNLPEQLGTSDVFEDLIAENVSRAQIGDLQVYTDREEAIAHVGFSARLPDQSPTGQEYRVQPGSQLTFDIDLALVEQLLSEIGLGDLELPPDIDGSEVDLNIESALLTAYGDCRLDEMFNEDGDPLEVRFDNCLVLAQTPSPSISAPEGLNLPEIGSAFLQMMGLSPEEAEEFSRTVDWTTTLVIPIPRYGSSYQTVAVDGVEGTLIRQEFQDHAPSFLLIWVRDEVIYSITGTGTGQEGLLLANSLN